MKNIQIRTGTIRVLDRLPSSTNGNPRYAGLIQDGDGWLWEFRTAVDSDLAYGLPNYCHCKVQVEIGMHYGKPTLNSIRKVEN